MGGGGGGGFQPMGGGGFGGAQHRGAAAAAAAPFPGVVANPDLVESLMGITGMPRHQVEQALVATNNNPDAATAQLLRLD